MRFGVFDHLDNSGLALGEFCENRLLADALRAQGLEPSGLGADAFAKFIREDLVRRKTMAAELGIRAEN